MEKLLNPYDKECMRMAMLKHEETFREQVYELHRLYQIQKVLMKNIASSRKNWKESDKRRFKIAPQAIQASGDHQDKRHQSLDLELRVEDQAVREGKGTADIDDDYDDDESELELTLGLGPLSQCTRRKSLETSINSDSAASFSSSSTGSNHTKKIDSGTHLRKNTNRDQEVIGWRWGLDHLHSSNPSVLGARKNGSDIEEQFRQDRQHRNPPWLFQALSLNTT